MTRETKEQVKFCVMIILIIEISLYRPYNRMTDSLGTLDICNIRNFLQKLPLAFHSSLSKQFLLFFCDLPYLGFSLVSNISLNFVIFSTSSNTLWNSMSPFCIACDMISAMLSTLLWASSLVTSCFSCFLVNISKD